MYTLHTPAHNYTHKGRVSPLHTKNVTGATASILPLPSSIHPPVLGAAAAASYVQRLSLCFVRNLTPPVTPCPPNHPHPHARCTPPSVSYALPPLPLPTPRPHQQPSPFSRCGRVSPPLLPPPPSSPNRPLTPNHLRVKKHSPEIVCTTISCKDQKHTRG